MGQPDLRQGVLYLRKSKGRAGISRQRGSGKGLAAKLGIEIIAEYVDVDRTAYQQVGGDRPQRDGFTNMLAHLRRSGRDNPLTVISLHADRLVRSDIDTRELTEICADRRHPVETVRGGGYELWTATGRKRLRDDASAAAFEVDHLTERINDMKAEAAANGRWPGGVRPFGFEDDGVTVRESEGREVAAGTEALLAGETMVGAVRDLNRRGVLTAKGNPWGTTQWRRVLLRPRNAGLLMWQGSVVGHAEWGRWMDADESIWGCLVGEDQWEALRRLLTNPNRRSTPGPERRWLGSGTYRCGVCGSVTIAWSGGNPQNRWCSYRCDVKRRAIAVEAMSPDRKPHVARRADHVDRYVTAVLLTRLARPDAMAWANEPEPEHRERLECHRKLTWLRSRLDEQAELHAAGAIDAAQLVTGTARLRAEMAAVQERLEQFDRVDALSGMAGNPDVAKLWPALSLARQRAILDAVMTVTILPATKRGRQPGGGYFDADSVLIEWKTG